MAPKITREIAWVDAHILSGDCPLHACSAEIFASEPCSLLKSSPSLSTVSTLSFEEMDIGSDDDFVPSTPRTDDANSEYSFDAFVSATVNAPILAPTLASFPHEDIESLLAMQEREREHQERILELEVALAAKSKEVEESVTHVAELLQDLRQQHLEKLDELYTSVHEIEARQKQKRREQQQSYWFCSTCVSASTDVHQFPIVLASSAASTDVHQFPSVVGSSATICSL